MPLDFKNMAEIVMRQVAWACFQPRWEVVGYPCRRMRDRSQADAFTLLDEDQVDRRDRAFHKGVCEVSTKTRGKPSFSMMLFYRSQT